MDLADEARRRGKGLRILVTRLRFLGDVIISTSAVAALRARYPEAAIYYLTEAAFADVLEENPDIDGIIRLEKGIAGFFRALKTVRSLDITAAVDLFYNPTSANLLFLSRIPVRVGGARKWRRRMYTETVRVPDGVRSAVEHHIHMMQPFDCGGEVALPKVLLSEREKEAGRRSLSKITGRGGAERVVAFHPGGTWQSKRWPAGRFGELAGIVSGMGGGTGVMILTGPGEEDLSRAVESESDAEVAVVPTLPLRDTAALIAACDAVIANDGGVMHLSVALGVPTVAVFGPTEKDIWFPYEGYGPFAVVSDERECAPCHLHECPGKECLKAIRPETVAEGLRRVTGW